MKCRWKIGGLEIPGIGVTKENTEVMLENSQAKELISRGVAEIVVINAAELTPSKKKRGED